MFVLLLESCSHLRFIHKRMERITTMNLYQVFVFLVITVYEVLPVTLRITADYVAPVKPCRVEDTFCYIKCTVLQLRGDFQCDFCVCANKTDYVKWETDPTATAFSSTTLPPDVIRVNDIMYHKVSDPCDLSRDRVCPMKCTEVDSVTDTGANCTMCDCQGRAVLIG